MAWVWICEPLASLFPNIIWFKAYFLITVLNSGNYSLRLRALLFFFIDLLKCSNLWWLSVMSFLPLILSPHSFSLCLSLRSCPQTSLGLLKELGVFLFLMQSRSSFHFILMHICCKKAMTVNARAGYLGSELKLGCPWAFRSCGLFFEVVLVKASFRKLFLSLTWQASGMEFASAYHWCVYRGLLCVTHLH